MTAGGTTASRVQSVTNNFGYQLKIAYALNSPTTAAQLAQWITVASVTGINNAVDYCDPSANSCTGLTQSWPTLTYGTSTTVPNTVTVTDPLGHVTSYTYNTSSSPEQVSGIMSPLELRDVTQILEILGWFVYRFVDGTARFMCSWATAPDAVDELGAVLKSIV